MSAICDDGATWITESLQAYRALSSVKFVFLRGAIYRAKVPLENSVFHEGDWPFTANKAMRGGLFQAFLELHFLCASLQHKPRNVLETASLRVRRDSR